MAFFDDLGKKISYAGQTAVQKTKDMTDLARLNENIAAEEKKISANHYQIGKLYAAMHAYDYEPDFEGFIMAIRDSEAKIQEFRQQIKDIKGIERCENCGADVAADTAFCSACGSPMPRKNVVQAENAVKCPVCGQMMEADMRFCTACGHAMVNMVQNSVPEPPKQEEPKEYLLHEEQETKILPREELPEEMAKEPPTPPESADATETSDKFCTECGAELSEGFAFCTECGAKLS